jgi:hypothetical protein
VQLASCSQTPSRVTINKPPCVLPAMPSDPGVEIYDEKCPEGMVCISLQSAVDIGRWVKQVIRIKEQLDLCPHIHWNGGNSI